MKIFKEVPSIVKIGIWGPPRSGKTAFLVALRFTEREGWKIRPLDEASRELYVTGTDMMRQKKEFLGPTQIKRPDFMIFEFEGPGKFLAQSRSFRVILPEVSGEIFANPRSEVAQPLINELEKMHAIIWLIDPEQIDSSFDTFEGTKKSYRAMIDDWLLRLVEKQGGGRLDKYIAFCLTKMDLPKHNKHFDDPETYCLDLLGEDFEDIFTDLCDPKKVEFFSTSSIGFKPDTNISNIDPSNPGKLLFPAQPIYLFEPFRWLFQVL